MSIHLHHVTADDADRDRRRTPHDLTNAEIEEQRQRSIVQSQLQIDRLTLSLTIRDNEVAALRREIDALRAQVARLTRKQPRWWEWALAWLLCRAEALGERINRAWAHEGWR
jgi:predicted RNase H-like nuclease (RuvC/YqgF family)